MWACRFPAIKASSELPVWKNSGATANVAHWNARLAVNGHISLSFEGSLGLVELRLSLPLAPTLTLLTSPHRAPHVELSSWMGSHQTVAIFINIIIICIWGVLFFPIPLVPSIILYTLPLNKMTMPLPSETEVISNQICAFTYMYCMCGIKGSELPCGKPQREKAVSRGPQIWGFSWLSKATWWASLRVTPLAESKHKRKDLVSVCRDYRKSSKTI